ncbi:MAG: hypothetical protein FD170_298 [Bacteroidetes bacterium]|nr:MAG: hypothetical protein FD170_298 [Bacteroidota bacterium]
MQYVFCPKVIKLRKDFYEPASLVFANFAILQNPDIRCFKMTTDHSPNSKLAFPDHRQC